MSMAYLHAPEVVGTPPTLPPASDHAGLVEHLPTCPSWCTLPRRHDIDVAVPPGDPILREHYRFVFEFVEHRAGKVHSSHVGVVRLDELLDARGPACTGTAFVEAYVHDSTHLTSADARRIAAALVEAADLLDADEPRLVAVWDVDDAEGGR